MAETSNSLRSLHAALDPKSLILSQFSSSNTVPDKLTEGFSMERGPRFKEYSDLRDRKLRMKNKYQQLTPEKKSDEIGSILTPPKKQQVKLISNLVTPPKPSKRPSNGSNRSGRHSVLAQSVPEFSSALPLLRKENRRPAAAMMPVAERRSGYGNGNGKLEVGGSKSANSLGEKRSGSGSGWKSYAGNIGTGNSKTLLRNRLLF
ncbi:uncharacterized protein LOC127242254 [Andrographis paniculata]|uniref:uncharacterized protein LOC127242254 n=1 Tax=Andrographis paniculata TaxID=175694 RepID=UPI0021E71064|nr:uncharacterized protein LOC127242254 [Andrographis paniculata]